MCDLFSSVKMESKLLTKRGNSRWWVESGKSKGELPCRCVWAKMVWHSTKFQARVRRLKVRCRFELTGQENRIVHKLCILNPTIVLSEGNFRWLKIDLKIRPTHICHQFPNAGYKPPVLPHSKSRIYIEVKMFATPGQNSWTGSSGRSRLELGKGIWCSDGDSHIESKKTKRPGNKWFKLMTTVNPYKGKVAKA